MSTIVKNTFFVGDIFLPQAKPTITSDVSEVDSSLIEFIKDKEEECLSNCLGELYFEFKSKLDLSKPEGIITDDGGNVLADDLKWVWLLNGRKEYVNSKGKKRTFKGLRYKSSDIEDSVYDRSLIAYYIYYFFKRSSYVSTTTVGDTIPYSKNAKTVTPDIKATEAWRKFFKLTVGSKLKPRVYSNKYGYGIDYYNSENIFVSLYEFINDMNLLEANTYENFNPKNWLNTNIAGI